MAMIKQVYEGEGVALTGRDGAEALVLFDGFGGDGSPTEIVRLRSVEGETRSEYESATGEGVVLELDGSRVDVLFHGLVGRGSRQINLRIHAPQDVKIESADARYDEVEG